MDYPANDRISQVCKIHNQPIVCYEQIIYKPNCQACILEKADMLSAETQLRIKEIINKDKQNYINKKDLYQNIYNQIQNCKKTIIVKFDKILQIIQDQIKKLDSFLEINLQYKENKKQEMSIGDLEKESQQKQLCNDRFKNQVKLQLNEFQKKFLPSEQLITSFDKMQKIVMSEKSLDWNKVECELIKESRKKENQTCWAFAFNKENTILIVVYVNEIIVYQFVNGMITQELQRLTNHTENIFCIYFMQQSNSFVSGSWDKTIIIWEFDNSKNNWFIKQTFQEHTDSVYCIVMNVGEDSLISGSEDGTLKFRKKIQNSWSCQQTIDMQGTVYAISLNEMEDKLISCGRNSFFISIMEKEHDDQWRIVQTIIVNCYGWRLCFTNGDQFVFQPRNDDKLEVYSYDKGKKQFQISQKVQINKQFSGQLFFPCQYIKSLKLISVKHGKQLNLFKINQAGDYKLIQSINFQSDCLFGRLTYDGQNLITWDGGSKEIQVRQLRFLK